MYEFKVKCKPLIQPGTMWALVSAAVCYRAAWIIFNTWLMQCWAIRAESLQHWINNDRWADMCPNFCCNELVLCPSALCLGQPLDCLPPALNILGNINHRKKRLSCTDLYHQSHWNVVWINVLFFRSILKNMYYVLLVTWCNICKHWILVILCCKCATGHKLTKCSF